MYSYEERILAVQIYIELGKRTAATIRSLGYPTKNALKSWYREYERSRDLPKGYVRSRSKYTDEQKKTAVEYYLSHGRCLATTRRALGSRVRQLISQLIDIANSDFKMLHYNSVNC